MADSLTRLRIAIAVSRHGGGAATATASVRRAGTTAFDRILASLTPQQADAVEQSAEQLLADGVDAVLLGTEGYPSSLIGSRTAPAVLFYKGPQRLLHRRGVGTCGSRHATEESLRAARACSEVVAAHGLNLISGYARGVDLVTHTGALASGGTTTVVLAEGIERFRIRRGEFTDVWDPERVVVLSQFSPGQPWSTGTAMARNTVISGLSKVLVVVEAGDTGGTLAAGLHALGRGQPVLVLQLPGSAAGNQILIDKGATPVRNRQDLETRLADLPANGTTQLALI